MAEQHTFTQADIEYIYNTLIDGGEKLSDVKRILKSLGPTFTIEELQSKANLKGLTSRSKDLWSQALSTLNQAVAAPAAAAPAAPGAGAPAGPTGPQLEDYMPGLGPINTMANDLLTGRPTSANTGYNASGTQPGGPFATGGAGGVTSGAPFHAPTSPTEAYLQGRLFGLQPTPPSALEQMIGGLAAGGPAGLVQQLIAPASSFETSLAGLGGNPFLNSIAQGGIPPQMQAALDAQLNLARANTMEATGMGGALTSSDLAEGLNRSESDARTKFLSDMAQQSLSAQQQLTNTLGTGGGLYGNRTGQGVSAGAGLYGNLLGQGLQAQQGRNQLDLSSLLGLGGQLLPTQSGANESAMSRFLGLLGQQGTQETGSREAGIGRMFQDFGASRGLPPELGLLLSLMNVGNTVKQTGTSTGGGLGDLLGGLGNIGGAAIGGAFGNPLAGLFGGGGTSFAPIPQGSYGGIPQSGTSAASGLGGYPWYA